MGTWEDQSVRLGRWMNIFPQLNISPPMPGNHLSSLHQDTIQTSQAKPLMHSPFSGSPLPSRFILTDIIIAYTLDKRFFIRIHTIDQTNFRVILAPLFFQCSQPVTVQ